MRKKLLPSEHKRKLRLLQDAESYSQAESILCSLPHVLFVNPIKPGQAMWRVINVSTRGDCVDDFSYAPMKHASLGRCNTAGQQVFYAGNVLGACINENKSIEFGTTIRVSKWETTKPILMLGIHKQNEREATYKRTHAKLMELFSHPEDDYYLQTSLITQWFFNQTIEPSVDAPSEIGGIMYPSVIPTTLPDTPINFAIRKSCIDDGSVKLKTCEFAEVTEIADEKYRYKTFCTGRVNSDGSSINWTEESQNSSFILPINQTTTITHNAGVWTSDNPDARVYGPHRTAAR